MTPTFPGRMALLVDFGENQAGCLTLVEYGAGEGNRTLTYSLGSYRSTTELLPLRLAKSLWRAKYCFPYGLASDEFQNSTALHWRARRAAAYVRTLYPFRAPAR